MLQIQITKEALRYIHRKLRWYFWVSQPVVMLIEFGKGRRNLSEVQSTTKSVEGSKKYKISKDNTAEKIVSKNGTSLMRLVPIVKSGKSLSEHYLRNVIEVDNFILIPHIKMIIYEKEVDQWLLDIGKEGLTLTADGIVVSGIPPIRR